LVFASLLSLLFLAETVPPHFDPSYPPSDSSSLDTVAAQLLPDRSLSWFAVQPPLPFFPVSEG